MTTLVVTSSWPRTRDEIAGTFVRTDALHRARSGAVVVAAPRGPGAARSGPGLEVIDVENLRRHYAPTLDAWAERFERNWEAIRALDPARFDERFRRIWLTYLIGCAEMFRSPAGYTHLFQIVFSKGNVTDASYPMGRGFLHAG